MISIILFDFSEFAVDFLADHPIVNTNKKQDILFHFNPRPPNILLLDTCKQNKWDRGVQLMDDEFNRTFFKKPFELAIKRTNGKGIDEDMSEFGVFVDRKFLTTYLCPFRITTAEYIQFSRNVRITANINTF